VRATKSRKIRSGFLCGYSVRSPDRSSGTSRFDSPQARNARKLRRRGLLKVEQLHALARDLFYGRRGRINARELWEQMNTCSCLTLILACIVYWQAREISRVLSQCDPAGNGIDLSLLEHVSPIESDNVVLYGQYILDRKLVRQRRRVMRATA
jgi:Tn3 transposase DDE domain